MWPPFRNTFVVLSSTIYPHRTSTSQLTNETQQHPIVNSTLCATVNALTSHSVHGSSTVSMQMVCTSARIWICRSPCRIERMRQLAGIRIRHWPIWDCTRPGWPDNRCEMLEWSLNWCIHRLRSDAFKLVRLCWKVNCDCTTLRGSPRMGDF